MSQQPMPIYQFHPKEFRLSQHINHSAFKVDDIESRHAKMTEFTPLQ